MYGALRRRDEGVSLAGKPQLPLPATADRGPSTSVLAAHVGSAAGPICGAGSARSHSGLAAHVGSATGPICGAGSARSHSGLAAHVGSATGPICGAGSARSHSGLLRCLLSAPKSALPGVCSPQAAPLCRCATSPPVTGESPRARLVADPRSTVSVPRQLWISGLVFTGLRRSPTSETGSSFFLVFTGLRRSPTSETGSSFFLDLGQPLLFPACVQCDLGHFVQPQPGDRPLAKTVPRHEFGIAKFAVPLVGHGVGGRRVVPILNIVA